MVVGLLNAAPLLRLVDCFQPSAEFKTRRDCACGCLAHTKAINGYNGGPASTEAPLRASIQARKPHDESALRSGIPAIPLQPPNHNKWKSPGHVMCKLHSDLERLEAIEEEL